MEEASRGKAYAGDDVEPPAGNIARRGPVRPAAHGLKTRPQAHGLHTPAHGLYKNLVDTIFWEIGFAFNQF